MPLPKHNYAYVVLSPYQQLMRSDGDGVYFDGGFGEVFLDKKVALHVRNEHRRACRRLAETDWSDPRKSERWKMLEKGYKVLKIALPGTYSQFQVPGRLEREMAKDRR